MEEIWKDIKGYEGKYQVSNLGRVKSLNYRRTKQERILKQTLNNCGYCYVTINGTCSVHKLVADAFIPNPNNYNEINHIDENKLNNCVDNLEWCDRQYNNDYSLSKQIFQYDKDLNLIAIYPSSSECGKNGLFRSNICRCCNGKIKSYKGYIWSYKELNVQVN